MVFPMITNSRSPPNASPVLGKTTPRPDRPTEDRPGDIHFTGDVISEGLLTSWASKGNCPLEV